MKKISYHKRWLNTFASKSRFVGDSIRRSIMVSTMDPNFKSVNTILLICIAVLSYEVYILTVQQSEMLATIQALNEKLVEVEKLSKLERVEQLSKLEGVEQNIAKSNEGIHFIAGTVILITVMVTLIYFGGIDPGDLGGAINANTNRNEVLNQQILNEMVANTDKICKKVVEAIVSDKYYPAEKLKFNLSDFRT